MGAGTIQRATERHSGTVAPVHLTAVAPARSQSKARPKKKGRHAGETHSGTDGAPVSPDRRTTDSESDIIRHRWDYARQQMRMIASVERKLEFQHFKWRFLRKKCVVFFGLLTWIPIFCVALAIPLFLPFGWRSVASAAGKTTICSGAMRTETGVGVWAYALLLGWCLLPLGIQWVLYPTGSFCGACWFVPTDGTWNLLFFLPNYIEAFIVGCHTLALSIFFLAIDETPAEESAGLRIACLAIALHLCFLFFVRVFLIRTWQTLIKLAILSGALLTIVSFYIAVGRALSVEESSRWWNNPLCPAIALSATCFCGAWHLMQLGRRWVQDPSCGAPLGWEFDFRLRFMAAVSEPPFLLSRKYVKDPAVPFYPLEKKEVRPLLGQMTKTGSIYSSPIRYSSSGEIVLTMEDTDWPEKMDPDSYPASRQDLEAGNGGSPELEPILPLPDVQFQEDPPSGKTDPIDRSGKSVNEDVWQRPLSSRLTKYSTDKRIVVSQQHMRLIQGMKQGFFTGAIGLVVLGVAVIFGGVHMSHSRRAPTARPSEVSFVALELGHDTHGGATAIPTSPAVVTLDATPSYSTLDKRVARKKGIPSQVLESPVPHSVQKVDADSGSEQESSASSAKNKLSSAGGVIFSEKGLTASPRAPQNLREELEDEIENDFLFAERLVSSSGSWWLWVSGTVVGMILATQCFVRILGGWMEGIMFRFLSISNRSSMEDLKLPDYDLLSSELTLTHEEKEKCRDFINFCHKNGYQMFMQPKFEGCHKSPSGM